MPAEIVIRRASSADRGQLVAFHHALYVEYRLSITDPSLLDFYAYRDLASALREDVDAILAGKGSVALIAELSGSAVGYATGHVEHDPRRVLSRKGVVEDWYVDPQARGQGVGRRLIEALLERFREEGCVVAESATWPFNALGRGAHEALGFQEAIVQYRLRLDRP